MDLSKFLSLLISKSLHFSRLDLLGDDWEGATTKASKEALNAAIKLIEMPSDKKEAAIGQLSKMTGNARKWIYANCWHMNLYESAAMWKLYSAADEAIAVRVRYDELADLLPSEVHLGCIRYIDYYDESAVFDGNLLSPAMHKRRSFSHECVVRAALLSVENQEEPPSAQKVKIDVQRLVATVFVSPDAPDWFHETVSSVTEKMGYNIHYIRSALRDPALF